mmetsp:Transcript_106723/g.259217  ORF Transcript_106723/g.259217 Transcript_106723/m.259217 type:complete len:87 (-) Transcript_106723:126-386(-)
MQASTSPLPRLWERRAEALIDPQRRRAIKIRTEYNHALRPTILCTELKPSEYFLVLIAFLLHSSSHGEVRASVLYRAVFVILQFLV